MRTLLDRLVDGMAMPEDPKLIIKSFLRNPHPTARLMKTVTFHRLEHGPLVIASPDFIRKQLKLGNGVRRMKSPHIWIDNQSIRFRR